MYNPSNKNWGDENSRNFENSISDPDIDDIDDIDEDKIIIKNLSKRKKTKEFFPKNFWYIYAQ